MNRFIFCFILLSLTVGNQTFGQEKTKVKGVITDVNTGEPLPFVNVSFVGKNVGTTTDFDGKYQLDTQWGSDKVAASFMGYESMEKPVTQGRNNTVDFKLEPKQIKLEEVVVKAKGRYRNKENPAVALIKKVIENKDLNRMEGFDHYQFDKYEKLQLDLNNITPKFMERKIFKKYGFMWDYVDTSKVNGKPFLPLYLTETTSEVYLRSEPNDKKEITTGLKTVGFDEFMDEEGIGFFIEKIYQDIDVYDNSISVMEKQFTSPISVISPNIYKFFIVDTVMMEEAECIHMKFQPRNSADLAFRGDIWIVHDSTYAVKQVDMNITRSANINYVSALEVSQKFSYSKELKWHLVKDKLTIDYNLFENTMGMYGNRTVTYDNVVANVPAPDSIWSGPARNVIQDEARNRDDSFWEEERHEELTESEAGVYEMTGRIKDMPSFKRAMNLIFFALSGFYEAGPLDIGPLYNIVSVNPVERWRFRLTVKTNDKLSKKWRLTSYLAYGLDERKDRRFKGGAGATYFINRRPYQRISAEFQRDIQQPGQDLLLYSFTNLFQSFAIGQADLMMYFDSYRIDYYKEWDFDLGLGVTLEHRRRQGAGALVFDAATDGIQAPNEVVTNEVNVALRYSPNLKYYEGRQFRVPMFNHHPIFDFTYTYAIPQLLGAQYDYHKFGVQVFKRFRMGPAGFGDSRWGAGIILGNVPYPLLFVHAGNQTLFLDRTAFTMMNWLEFVSDKFVSINYEHHFNGFLLNRVPLIKKLKWRVVADFNAVWGGVSVSNTPGMTDETGVFSYPVRRIEDGDGNPIRDAFGNEQFEQATYSLERMPYAEVAFGIENIFKFFTIKVIRRLTYLENPNLQGLGAAKGWGLKFRASVRF